ncbi:component of the Tol biopolymer transport system [Candidatus Methanophagaceae archaeon]|jgi:Tol biopolymer transport system component|nr:component of the Tol biopolymer transport system [Methanophagales archaeon]
MSKNGKRKKKGLVNRQGSKGLAFGALAMLFVATIVPVGMAVAADVDDGGDLFVSIKGGKIPSLSSNFKKVSYTTLSAEESDELWVMNTDGSELKKLDDMEEWECIVGEWCPDGKRILYYKVRGKPPKKPSDSTLWVIKSDGTGKKIIEGVYPPLLTRYRHPAIWSTDGNKIAYVGGDGICVVNADGSENKVIIRGELFSWTPDSKRIILSYKGIREIDVVSGLEKVLNATVPTKWISVSPDASKIAYCRHAYRPYGIYVSNIDGSELKQLTYSENDDPYWSTDSKRIAFISREEGIRCGIWVMNSDGGNQEKVVELSYEDICRLSPFGGTKYLAWSQDGSKIAYASYDSKNETTNIYTINVGKPSPIKPPAGEAPKEKPQRISGFEVLFAIAGLLAVAYLLRGKK